MRDDYTVRGRSRVFTNRLALPASIQRVSMTDAEVDALRLAVTRRHSRPARCLAVAVAVARAA